LNGAYQLLVSIEGVDLLNENLSTIYQNTESLSDIGERSGLEVC